MTEQTKSNFKDLCDEYLALQKGIAMQIEHVQSMKHNLEYAKAIALIETIPAGKNQKERDRNEIVILHSNPMVQDTQQLLNEAEYEKRIFLGEETIIMEQIKMMRAMEYAKSGQ